MVDLASNTASLDDVIQRTPTSAAPKADPLFDDLVKQAGALRKDTEATSATLAEGAKAKLSIAEQISKLRPPEPPKLDPPAKPPGEAPETNPLQAFGSPASWLAVFGGLLTRRPLQTSLDASAAAMNAYRQRDLEGYDQHLKTWKTQSDYAQKTQEYQQALYRDAMASHKGNIDQLLASLNMIASANQDTIAQHTLKTGDFALFEKLYHDRQAQLDRFATHREALARDAETARHHLALEQRAPAGSLNAQLLNQWAKEEEARTGQPVSADAKLKRLEKIVGAGKPPTASQIKDEERAAEVAAVLDLGDDTITQFESVKGALGLAGKALRPGETVANLLKASDDTTRRQVESNITTLRNTMLRLLNDRSILTKADHADAQIIIRGLEPGSTIQNTTASIRTMQGLLARKYDKALRRNGFLGGEAQPQAGGSEEAPSAPAARGGPPVGHEEDGYRFLGGDLQDKANWEKVD